MSVHSEFGNVCFWGEGKSVVSSEKPLRAEQRTNNELNPASCYPFKSPSQSLQSIAVVLVVSPQMKYCWPCADPRIPVTTLANVENEK